MRKNLSLFLPLIICLGVICCISQTGCRVTGPPYKTSSWHFYNPFSSKSKLDGEDELAKKIDDMPPSYASTLPKAEVSTPHDGYSSNDRSSIAGNSKSSSTKIAKSDIKYDSKINSDPHGDLQQTPKLANSTSYGTTSPVNGIAPVTSPGANYVASNAQGLPQYNANTTAPYTVPQQHTASQQVLGNTATATASYGYSPTGADQNQFAQNQFPSTASQNSGMGRQTGDSIGSTNGAMPDPNMMMAGIPAAPQNNNVFPAQNGVTSENKPVQQPANAMPQTVAQQNSVPGNYQAAGNYPVGMQPTDSMGVGSMGAGSPVNSGMAPSIASNMGNPYSGAPMANVSAPQMPTQGLSPNATPYNNTYTGNAAVPSNPNAYTQQQPASTYNGGFSSFAPAASDGYRPGGY